MTSLLCSICLEPLEDQDDICSTICLHIFHYSCLLSWQLRSNACPLCNRMHCKPRRIVVNLKYLEKSTAEEDFKVIIEGLYEDSVDVREAITDTDESSDDDSDDIMDDNDIITNIQQNIDDSDESRDSLDFSMENDVSISVFSDSSSLGDSSDHIYSD